LRVVADDTKAAPSGFASVRTESRPPVRMTPTRIPKSCTFRLYLGSAADCRFRSVRASPLRGRAVGFAEIPADAGLSPRVLPDAEQAPLPAISVGAAMLR
jgi:hypothetical protein